jgi:hypothetical protein
MPRKASPSKKKEGQDRICEKLNVKFQKTPDDRGCVPIYFLIIAAG